jgi:hypothetical protein
MTRIAMNQLHDMFMNQLEKLVPELIAQTIGRKFAKLGISMSEADRRRLVAQILESKPGSFKFHKWRFWDNRSIDIDFTPEEIAEMESKSSAILEKLPGVAMSAMNEITDHMVGVLKKRWPRQKRTEQRSLKTFRSNLARRWQVPLDLLSMILTISRELGSAINDQRRMEGPIGHLFDVLTRLHARACQVAGEIISLLYAGYADGAMARWRTLHEIAVTALFIQNGGEECAERYSLHAHVDSYKAALNYQKVCDRLGEPPFEQTKLESMKESCDKLRQRFGPEFLEPYGWAAASLSNRKPKFADIEEDVGIDHLRPYYKMASYNVHANPKGVFYKLGLIPETPLLLAGPSNFGLADPGQNTALSLGQVSSALISLNPTMDAILSAKVMLALSSDVAESFVGVQLALEQEERENA